MTFLVISDIHFSEDILKKVLKTIAEDIDGIIFAGDGMELLKRNIKNIPLYASKGNVDKGRIPLDLDFAVNGFHVFLTHGHQYKVKNGLNILKQKIHGRNFDLVIFGHTHIPVNVKYNSTVFYNPGALSFGYYGILTIKDKDFYLDSCKIE